MEGQEPRREQAVHGEPAERLDGARQHVEQCTTEHCPVHETIATMADVRFEIHDQASIAA